MWAKVILLTHETNQVTLEERVVVSPFNLIIPVQDFHVTVLESQVGEAQPAPLKKNTKKINKEKHVHLPNKQISCLFFVFFYHGTAVNSLIVKLFNISTLSTLVLLIGFLCSLRLLTYSTATS